MVIRCTYLELRLTMLHENITSKPEVLELDNGNAKSDKTDGLGGHVSKVDGRCTACRLPSCYCKHCWDSNAVRLARQ